MPQRKNPVPDVINSIFKATSDQKTQTAMVFGSGLESRWNDTASNPSGAVGPFQILLPVHSNITKTQAENPDYATNYMLSAYEQAVKQVPESLWTDNPELAAEQAAILAEQPGGTFPQNTVGPYGSESTTVVNQVWGEASQLLSGKGIDPSNLSTGGSTISIPNATIGGVTGDFAKMGAALTTGNPTAFANALGNIVWSRQGLKLAILIFGAIIVLIGLHKLGVRPVRTAKKAAGTAAEVAGTVTGNPEIAAAGAASKARARREKREEAERAAMKENA